MYRLVEFRREVLFFEVPQKCGVEDFHGSFAREILDDAGSLGIAHGDAAKPGKERAGDFCVSLAIRDSGATRGV